MLPAKSLTINTCYRVTDFPDQCINLVFLGLLIVILILISKLEILRFLPFFAHDGSGLLAACFNFSI